MTILLDDHLVRDYLADEPTLRGTIDGQQLATTNLWYARLCKSVVRWTGSAPGGALLSGWSETERLALGASLMALPNEITTVPMRDLAWTMGQLVATRSGLSTLGAEAVAAAAALDARILVSSRDDSPGIRSCCGDLGLRYDTLAR